MNWLDVLTGAVDGGLYALDTPGALTRGVLSGRPGERVDGRDMLEHWGVVGQNQAGLDWGDVAGFAAGIATDPLTYASGGLGLVAKALRGPADDAARGLLAGADLPPSLVGGWGAMDDLAATAPAGNLDQLAIGYRPAPQLTGRRLFPDEALANTLAKDEFGNPIKLYHGSPHGPVSQPSPDKWADGESLLFGPGHYMTANPEIASSYAKTDAGFIRRRPTPEEIAARPTQTSQHPVWLGSDEVLVQPNQAVSSYYLDSRNPFDMVNGQISREDAIRILENLNQGNPINSIQDHLDDAYTGFVTSNPQKFYEDVAYLVGNSHMNEALKQSGYDAIRHTGGQWAGRGKTLHDVWIALNPESVYEPFLQSAVQGKWADPPVNPMLLAALLGGGSMAAMQPQ